MNNGRQEILDKRNTKTRMAVTQVIDSWADISINQKQSINIERSGASITPTKGGGAPYLHHCDKLHT